MEDIVTTDNVRALATRSPGTISMRTDNLDTLTVAKMLAESGFFGEVKQAGQALAKMLAGQELGMGPIASLMGVYYQQGKVTYSANIMAAAIKRSGVYTYRIRQHDTAVCEIEFFERGESIGRSSFTMEEARQANLLSAQGKGNWEKYPRNMLFARAMSNGCKWFCPDIFGGATPYTPDELDADVIVTADGDIRPKITDAPSTPVGADPEGNAIPPTGWTQAAEQRWQSGVAKAGEVGATVPEKPAEDAPRDVVLAALQELAANIKGRRELIEALTEVAKVANEAGGDFAVPENLADLSDEQLREMTSAIQETIAVAEVA